MRSNIAALPGRHSRELRCGSPVGYEAMRSSTSTQWMAASLAMALVIAFIAGAAAPAHEKLGMALRATARWSFVLFWLASAGGALASLFGSAFQPLARRGRDLGLAFASAHLVHVG